MSDEENSIEYIVRKKERKRWIPAFAGMKKKGTGMTKRKMKLPRVPSANLKRENRRDEWDTKS